MRNDKRAYQSSIPEDFQEVDIIRQLESLRELQPTAEIRDRIWRTALDNAASLSENQTPISIIAVLLSRLRSARFHLAHVRLSSWSLRSALSLLFIVLSLVSPVRVIVAAQESLPGDQLYRVKRAEEHILLTSLPRYKQRDLRLALLERRIMEVEQLLASSSPVPDEALEELISLFRTMSLAPMLWKSSDDAATLVATLERYESLLFTLALEHREVYGLREVYRVSFYTREQLENTMRPTASNMMSQPLER
jgi:hypothetical protein